MSNKKTKSVGYTEPTNGRNMVTKYKFRIVRFEVPEPAPRTEKENQLRKHLRYYYMTLISLIVNVFGVAISIWSPKSIFMTIFAGIWLVATAWTSIIVTINLMNFPQTIIKLREEVEAEKSNSIDISDSVANDEESTDEEATGTTDTRASIINLATIPEFRNK